jgi:hypothetical protein
MILAVKKVALFKSVVHFGDLWHSAHVPDLGRDAISEDHPGFVYQANAAVLIAGGPVIWQRAPHQKVTPQNLVALALIKLNAGTGGRVFNPLRVDLKKPSIYETKPQTQTFLCSALAGRYMHHAYTFAQNRVAFDPLLLAGPIETDTLHDRLEGNEDDAPDSCTVERGPTELHWYDFVHVRLCISGHKRLDRILDSIKIDSLGRSLTPALWFRFPSVWESPRGNAGSFRFKTDSQNLLIVLIRPAIGKDDIASYPRLNFLDTRLVKLGSSRLAGQFPKHVLSRSLIRRSCRQR